MVTFYDGMVAFSDEADVLSGETGHPYGIKVLRGLSVRGLSGELTVRSMGGTAPPDMPPCCSKRLVLICKRHLSTSDL